MCSLTDDEAQLDEHDAFASEVDVLRPKVNPAELTLLETMLDANRDDACAWLFDERCRKFHDQNPSDKEELRKRWQQLLSKGVFTSESHEAQLLDEWMKQQPAAQPEAEADELVTA